MLAATKTTTALLEALRDPAAQTVWGEFDARFRPILRAFAIRTGLGEADADDVTQETLTRFMSAYRKGNYERDRGRLSSWIIAIAQNCIRDLRRGLAGRLERRGESAFVEVLDSNELESIWDEECRRALLQLGLRELREETRTDPRTIRAFEMLALEKCDAGQVAAEMQMSVDSVYMAKNRCLNQLREIMERLRQVYEFG